MQLQLLSFTGLVRQFAAAAQTSTATVLDFAGGAIMRAIAEANASVALWVQYLCVKTLRMTRAATSQGADLDTWMTDYTLSRNAAATARGLITLSRFTATSLAVVPVGAQVKTGDGTQSFVVVVDATHSAWNASLNGYVISAGVASLAGIPVQAVTAGTGGNAQAGTVTLLASAMPGVDTVSNPAAFAGGANAESDAAFRARFQAFILALREGTTAAVIFAAQSGRAGISVAVLENQPRSGAFIVVVDDGTGSPPSTLTDAVYASVDAVRPVGSAFSVQGPHVVAVSVSFAIAVAAGVSKPSLLAPVGKAVADWIGALPLGATLPYSRIAQIAYDAAPGQIVNVTSVLVNGATTDLVPTDPTAAYRGPTVTVA